MNNIYLHILLVLIYGSISSAQTVIIQPTPKNISCKDTEVIFTYDAPVYILAQNDIETKAAEYFRHLLNKKIRRKVIISDEKIKSRNWMILFNEDGMITEYSDKQSYEINFDSTGKTVIISSAGQLGLLYGAVSLSALINDNEGITSIKNCNIVDGPSYSRRLFVADPSADDIPSLLDWALQNKLETVVIASRRHPWYEISDDYLKILKEIKNWRDKFGGPEVMQSHNIYEERDIVISDQADIKALKNVIKVSYEHGIRKLMILSDDTPPYKFGEGYILTDENDKSRFEHFEAANTYLMNELVKWFMQENMEIELFYVPAFYTYEEMHQGDMSLYLDTPWEKDAFDPFYRDLKYIGDNIDESVYLIWCGPYVRSRKITVDDLNDWTKNLNGRVPFLWDNTIYSHYPFTSTSMLTAWDNELPENFHEITAGNGMFINNDANSETGIIGTITTNDYLWNPETYEPSKSLRTAVMREYGKEVVDLVLSFKEVELNIRKTIGERKLWFEADSLWRQIRKVRYITEKNPFYYHLNYSRLKALRLQLKASVPEPDGKALFIEKLNDLFEIRDKLLAEIKMKNEASYLRLKDLTTRIPDIQKIK